MVTVHVESDEPVSLYRRGATFVNTTNANMPGERTTITKTGNAICNAPCDMEIDVSGKARFFVMGEDITESRSFRLDRYSSSVTIEVDPGSATLLAASWPIMSVGAGTMLIGTGVLAWGGLRQSQEEEFEGRNAFIAGGVVLGIGAAILSTGLAFLGEGQTGVDIRKGIAGGEDTAFHRDDRPAEVEPKYWLGQF